MDDKIMVSILCNTYNHQKYIRQALNGFLKQKTSFKFEILIHDDASTDGTANIIREYANKYSELIKPVFQTENQYSKHIPILFTYQYPRAKGKYLAICEGDDYWLDEYKLQKQVDFMEVHSEYSACVHRYIVVDEEGKEQNIKTFGYYGESEGGVYSLSDFEKKELPSQLASLLMRNNILDVKKGYPKSFIDIKLQGDIKIYLYLLAQGEIYRMLDVMSAYRFVQKKGGNSWSSRQIEQKKSYERWHELRKIEQLFSDEYGINVDLNKRKLEASVDAMRELKTYRGNIDKMLLMIILQKGLLCEIIKLTVERGIRSGRKK